MTNRRVGAILSSDNESKIVDFIGYGVYEDDFVPTEAVGPFAEFAREYQRKNPRIRLDNGKVVYGCECWWSSEKRIRRYICLYEEKGYTIREVDIDKIWEEYRREQKN